MPAESGKHVSFAPTPTTRTEPQQPPTETMAPLVEAQPTADMETLLPHVKAMTDFLGEVAMMLRKSWKKSLNDADLARLGVECTALDLDADADFVRPISLATMSAWLEETQPWLTRGYGPPGDPNMDERWKAFGMMNDLSGYVTAHGTDWKGVGVIDKHTKWWHCGTGIARTMHARHKRGSFDIQRILDYDTDRALPHITALMSQDTPLCDDELGGIELMCIIQLAFIRYLNVAYHRHGVIPVTLISGQGRTARVLHAYADVPARRIRVRKSRLMDFDKPESFKTDDWKHLLCWYVADPRTDVSTVFKEA